SELVLWKRPRSSTSAGARDWHLIAFVPKDNEASCIKITIPFSLSLSKSHLKSNGAKYATTSGKKIILELPIENGSDIYRVTYEHDNQPSMKYVFNVLILRDVPSHFESIRHQYLINTSAKNKYAMTITTTEGYVEIGEGKETNIELNELGQVVNLNQDEKLKIEVSYAAIDEDKTKFYLQTSS